MENFEENWEESSLIQIGARVPGEFAKKFTRYCRKKPVNQRKLFYYLAKWWYEQDVLIQEHISHGRIKEALSQIAEEVQVEDIVSGAEADISKRKRKSVRKSSESA